MKHHSYIVKATGDCNLRCRYCYYLAENDRHSSKMMPFFLIEKLLEQSSQLGENIELIWHGGEPLLRNVDIFREILRKQKAIQSRKSINFLNRIQTNATLIDEQWIDLFNKGNFSVGVSLDGPEWLHNQMRVYRSGVGSFQDTMKGIYLLKDADIDFSVLSVITKISLGHSKEIFDFFVDNEFRKLDFLPCLVMNPYLAQSDITETNLERNDFARFMINIFDLWFNSDDPQINIRYLEQVLLGLLGGKQNLCKFNGKCYKYVTIEYDGTVTACDNFLGYNNQFVFGNLKEQSLSRILDGEKRQRFIELANTVSSVCEKCIYFPMCHGGCRRHNYATENGFYGRNFFCDDIRKIFYHVNSKLQKYHPLLETKYNTIEGDEDQYVL
jgi:uncharacterized protein